MRTAIEFRLDAIEPLIPFSKWYEHRIKRQMQRVYAFENQLELRNQNGSWLTNFESKQFSQNGEDGIIREILDRLKINSGFFVEFGASDGSENCTRTLAENQWSGLWIEGDEVKAKEASRLTDGKPVAVVNEFIYRDNIRTIFQNNSVPKQFDLLVVDIDGNDWWVLKSLLTEYQPKIIALEYNAAMGMRKWVLPYNPDHQWTHDRWHGASLVSFTEMLKDFGLTLVGTDSQGVNAFFVRNEYASLFHAPGNVVTHYSPPRHLLPFGHPWRQDTTQMNPLTNEEAKAISISEVKVLNRSADSVDLIVEINNASNATLRSSGETPLHVAAWWGKDKGEPERFRLLWPIPPKSKRPTFVRLSTPTPNALLMVDVVQENVSWISESHKQSALAELPVN